jgi:hypothetical protein
MAATFRRRWLGFGRIDSYEGFSISYGHKTLNYSDERGTIQIGHEDGLLFPDSLSMTRPIREVTPSDEALILDRMLRALEWDGHHVRLWNDKE